MKQNNPGTRSNLTYFCTKCQRSLKEVVGCHTYCNGKNFLPILKEDQKTITTHETKKTH